MMVESMSATSSLLRRWRRRDQVDVQRADRRPRRAPPISAGCPDRQVEGMTGREDIRAPLPSPENSAGSAPLPMTFRTNIVPAWNLTPSLLQAPPRAASRPRALALAKQINGVVINADSMQVYREAPILTAQPVRADKARAPHLLYGHVSARELYSVGRWRADAVEALAQALAMGTACRSLSAAPACISWRSPRGLPIFRATPAEIRDEARACCRKSASQHCMPRLADARSRDRPSKPAPHRSPAALRAYEVFEATGRPLVEWQARPPSRS